MSITEAYNFIAIDDRIATAGQPTEAQFRDAGAAGYEVVINLAPDGQDTSLANERELLGELGIAYHHMPVAWTAPTVAEFERFATLMDAAQDKRVLVHCQGNYRVTAFFGVYAQERLGWSEAQADALMSRIWDSRPDFAMDETWKGFVAAARARI